jgi:hypothetical protein
MTRITSLSLSLVLSLGGVAVVEAQMISQSRSMDWTQAGVAGGIPNRTTVCSTLSPGATAAQINSAIAACASGQVVFLNAGTYNLSAQVNFGSKSNVTLRGAGANQTLLRFSNGGSCSGLPSTVCITSGFVDNGSPQNSTTWTAGYAVGATQITVGSTANMKVGGIIILDQLNDSSDSGSIFVCSAASCTDEGGNSFGRNNRGQQQLVKVVALSGNQVTFTPALRMPNWRASQSPGVFWNGAAPVVSGNGVEDLTVDATAATGENGIVLMYVSDSWAKGVRTMNPDRNHYWLWQSVRITIRDSYLYGGQSDHSTSYGVEDYSTGSNLVENNIFQHVTAPLSHNGANTGSVFGYNFAIDDNYTGGGSSPGWMIPGILYHEVGISHLLHEGNDGLGILHDDIHGTTHFNTVFRNHFYGDIWNNPPKTQNTAIINLASYGRFFNLIGNVLGRAGYYTTYETNLGENARAIYALGWSPMGGVPNDPQTRTTMFRWGNYDTVNGTSRFVAAEVPSGIPQFANPVPSSQTLPPSLYLSSKPAFFGSVPWPPIGPDVTTGSETGGHAHRIPARLCYDNTPKTSGILNFNASVCYGNSGATPAAPTNLRITTSAE